MESVSPWNPLDLFGVDDPHDHYQCIGLTKKGVQCKNRISQVRRWQAEAKWKSLAQLPRDSDEVKLQLPELAGLHLCRQYHQSQSGGIVQGWQNKLSETNHPSVHAEPASGMATGADVRRIPTPTLPPCEQSTFDQLVQGHEFRPSERKYAKIPIVPGHRCEQDAILIRKCWEMRSFPHATCVICQETLEDENEYVDCGDCSAPLHWTCLQAWVPQSGRVGLFRCFLW